MSIFSNINSACTVTDIASKIGRLQEKAMRRWERACIQLAQLSDGGVTRTNKKGVEKTRDLNPGRTVQLTFMLLKAGVAADVIANSAPDLAARFGKWDGAHTAIMDAARDKKVDVNDVAHLFGIVKSEDVVVASEPTADEKKKASKGTVKQQTKRAAKKTAKAA